MLSDSSGPKDCIKLSVPVTGETSGRLRWRMRFENLPDYTVDSIKEVAIRQLETIHLIQTDKAWYTPGQLVRFRILSLNHILYPLLDLVCLFIFSLFFSSFKYSARPNFLHRQQSQGHHRHFIQIKRVWVEDPTGATIVQWTNLTTVHGLHQLELQLSVEPVQVN